MKQVLMLAACVAAPLFAQETPDRGALMVRAGADTLVIDRFLRVGDTLKGVVQVKGQGRIEYHAILGPNDAIRTLLVGFYAPGAATTAAPAQRVRLTLRGDTVVAETSAGVQRIPTKSGAILAFNNALAISELFTRRARTTGGLADIPYFAVSNGATLMVSLRPVGADSITFGIAGQMQRFKVDPVGRILGGILAGTPYDFVRAGSAAADGLTLALRDSALAPKADYSAPAGATYTAEEVRVAGPAGALGGTFTKPLNARGRLAAVVTITGSGRQDRDEFIPYAGGIRLFRAVADTLSRRGIAVLRLDDRGMGASEGPAGGTSLDFADDIRAAIAYLRTRPDVDPARIAIVGHSEGGAIAPMIAATDPKLKAIVVMAGPGEAGIEISMAQNKYLFDRDTTLKPAQRDSLLRLARSSLDPAKQTIPWVKFWMSYDPAPTARQVKAATLIVQGETDRQVPVDQAEKLAALIRAGGNKDVTVLLFPATNHLFVDDPSGDFNNYDNLRSNRISANVLGALADWLAVRLK
jgi:dienelactone hydrolase